MELESSIITDIKSFKPISQNRTNDKSTLVLLIGFYPAALKGSGVLSYPERAGGRAAGQTSPVNTLTSIIFHGSFSNLARTFIALRSRTSSIMEVLPH